MKLAGGCETGPLMPKTASWICWPGRASRGQHHAIGRVEPLDDLAAGLAEHQRQLAVHPDLGVVVEDQLEHHGRPADVEVADSSRGSVTLVRYQLKARRPLDRRCSSAAGAIVSQPESSKSAACACGVMSLVRLGAPVGAEIGTRVVVLDLDDADVAVAPLRLDQPGAVVGAEIHDRRGEHRRHVRGLTPRRARARGRARMRPPGGGAGSWGRLHGHLAARPAAPSRRNRGRAPSTFLNQCGVPLGITTTSPSSSRRVSPPGCRSRGAPPARSA